VELKALGVGISARAYQLAMSCQGLAFLARTAKSHHCETGGHGGRQRIAVSGMICFLWLCDLLHQSSPQFCSSKPVAWMFDVAHMSR
jgi:hypothetical protein